MKNVIEQEIVSNRHGCARARGETWIQTDAPRGRQPAGGGRSAPVRTPRACRARWARYSLAAGVMGEAIALEIELFAGL
ncbi:unnamed protein product, partial [Brenthis ino]